MEVTKMQVGQEVFIRPGSFTWNPNIKMIRGLIAQEPFIIRATQLEFQNFHFDDEKTIPLEIQRAMQNGFHAIVRKYSGNKVVLSRREWQAKMYNQIEINQVYNAKIIEVKPTILFVEVQGLKVGIYITECSRTRMNNLENYFKVGNKTKVKITRKGKEFPFQISGSRKLAYSTINTTSHHYQLGEIVDATIAEPLDDEGCRIEITPAIPGILNGQGVSTLTRGQRVKGQIYEIRDKGLKCELISDQ